LLEGDFAERQLPESRIKALPVWGNITLETMWSRVLATVTKTPAASEMGRLAQLLKAAGLTP